MKPFSAASNDWGFVDNMEIGEEKLSTKQFSITKFPREIERLQFFN